MNYVSGATVEEKRLVKSIQTAVGAYADNSIGPVTLVDIASKVGASCWPLAVDLYEQPSIICKDILAFNPKSGCKNFKNCISGSFSYQSKPCSILINNGKTIYGNSCHYWLGNPETVIYAMKGGGFGMMRCLNTSELPAGVKWAVGGFGLLGNYDPSAEGFTGAYSDVLRRTNHTMLGIKNGLVFLCYCRNMTAQEVNAHAKKLNLEMAIMLDGGHVAAINSESIKINTSQVQYYAIQAV